MILRGKLLLAALVLGTAAASSDDHPWGDAFGGTYGDGGSDDRDHSDGFYVEDGQYKYSGDSDTEDVYKKAAYSGSGSNKGSNGYVKGSSGDQHSQYRPNDYKPNSGVYHVRRHPSPKKQVQGEVQGEQAPSLPGR